MIYIVIFNAVLVLALIVLVLVRTGGNRDFLIRNEFQQKFSELENHVQDEFQRNRMEFSNSGQQNRKELNETLRTSLESFSTSFDRSVKSFNELQKEKFTALEGRQNDLIQHTENKLELIRTVVEEKLERTLSERLKQSFSTVSTQLTEVQKGLGEMQVLANDVGGLKKVLSNVKMRGGFGEIQLQMLLESLLSPDQFEANVKIKSGTTENVEFAIKLPGRSDEQKFIWLPVDAKFPKDIFEQLQNAYEQGDTGEIENARKLLFVTIKKMAKTISEKYIDPPNTTDFAILFLPFEGIYAEVVRQAALLEEIQRDCKVIVTGPTTLGAILNSLQMGFKTLAIQKRSSEVWQVLSQVKNEFEKFGGMLQKAQNNIKTGLNQLDEVMGKRTRAIQRRLNNVEGMNDSDKPDILSLPDYQDEEESGES